MEASKKTRVHAYFVLSLLTGVRTEEARALTWDRLNLEPVGDVPPHVEVWRSVRKGGDTKTRKSRRTLALPTEVAMVLEGHRAAQEQDRGRAGERNVRLRGSHGADLPVGRAQQHSDHRDGVPARAASGHHGRSRHHRQGVRASAPGDVTCHGSVDPQDTGKA